MIVDRDQDSFVVNEKINQYEDVMTLCENYKFRLYVTNPCFEFWLLMHYEDCKTIDKVKMELLKRDSRYKKNKYNANKLVLNIDRALTNEAMFCRGLLQLKDSIGSNVGEIVKHHLRLRWIKRYKSPCREKGLIVSYNA